MWYDLFSFVYDPALERLYAPHRQRSVDALGLLSGDVVLDVPCGTGQSLPALVHAVGASGRVVGADASRGMLHRANGRAEKNDWQNVALLHTSVHDLDAALLAEATGGRDLDGVLCALGLTAFPDWEAAFERLWRLLRPGGRFVLLDVYAETPTSQSKAVEFVARADLSRRTWEPLARVASGFERQDLDADPAKMGGTLFLASGEKP